jgi:hypothetical protein
MFPNKKKVRPVFYTSPPIWNVQVLMAALISVLVCGEELTVRRYCKKKTSIHVRESSDPWIMFQTRHTLLRASTLWNVDKLMLRQDDKTILATKLATTSYQGRSKN